MAGSTTAGERPPTGDGDTATVMWCQLSRRAITIWRVRAATGAVAALAAVGLVIVLAQLIDPSTGIDAVDRRLTTSGVTFVAALVGAVAVLASAVMFTVAPRRYRHWRWLVDADTLTVECGWWRHRRVQVPIADVHTLSERTGPLQRGWRVCKVRAYSSGPIGSVTLPVLERTDVAALRHSLEFDDAEC